jgi:hypothetical protein
MDEICAAGKKHGKAGKLKGVPTRGQGSVEDDWGKGRGERELGII